MTSTIESRELKYCPKCDQHLPYEQFSPGRKKSRLRLKLAGWCKKCHASNEKERRESPSLIQKQRDRYENDLHWRASRLVCSIKKRSKREGVDFDLDAGWLSEKLKRGKCELTGLQFDFSIENRRRNSRTPSVDRITAGGGYTKANCRVVLYAVNCLLNDWGLDESLEIARSLVFNQGTSRMAA
jgi:hypothetical protein